MTVQHSSFRLNCPALPPSPPPPQSRRASQSGTYRYRSVVPAAWTSWWFSMEIRQDEWPWVFEKSSKPSLLISSLEALAVLAGP